MFNLTGSEVIFILLLALVVLGPEKLPGAIRRATQTYAELRKLGTGFQSEFRSAIDEPMREMRETADLIKDQADPKKIAADAEAAVDAERAEARRAAASAEDGHLIDEDDDEHLIDDEDDDEHLIDEDDEHLIDDTDDHDAAVSEDPPVTSDDGAGGEDTSAESGEVDPFDDPTDETFEESA